MKRELKFATEVWNIVNTFKDWKDPYYPSSNNTGIDDDKAQERQRRVRIHATMSFLLSLLLVEKLPTLSDCVCTLTSIPQTVTHLSQQYQVGRFAIFGPMKGIFLRNTWKLSK